MRYLWNDPKLMSNILMISDISAVKEHLAPFFCNNFYENLISLNNVEDPLMYVIYLLLDNEISNIGSIDNYKLFLNETRCGYLLSQLIEKKEIQDYFKIILQDILEIISPHKMILDIQKIKYIINEQEKKENRKKNLIKNMNK